MTKGKQLKCQVNKANILNIQNLYVQLDFKNRLYVNYVHSPLVYLANTH